ncbi:MAG: methyltransferase type 11 [Deltaproteobacteria bacterium RIFOXYA12_FULL_58_15]|nr:MAG: methyltransferase type 11 [Deltaproteobacteria bacterium RIFOXYA12_FULL_58_15]OGR08410.1 MAG: methyltransferase type 11 [Deltaproteobacteria bacterium RIFOXYB12_FULL_58_9]
MHQHHVCPWWAGYWLASPLRRLLQNPDKILTDHIKPGMTVVDVGSGMGFWTIPMARLVGPAGKVIALDVQDKMLSSLQRRVTKAGVGDRVETRLCPGDRLAIDDLTGRVDFILAFAVVHEVPDVSILMGQLHRALHPGGKVLVGEPAGRVPDHEFAEELAAAEKAGLRVVDRPIISKSRAVVLEKTSHGS